MRGIVVVTGLDQLPPSERWPRFVAPLAEELVSSGLGCLPDLEALRQQTEGGKPGPTEVAVELVNLGYGRQLLSRIVEGAGIRSPAAVVPERWRGFGCSDYFGSALAEQGYWDEAGQYWYVLPSDRVYERADLPLLVIGGPGVDAIDWGYRAGHTGLWAYYPIDGVFAWLAPTTDALLQGWRSGAITV
jgi:hypothetical protein